MKSQLTFAIYLFILMIISGITMASSQLDLGIGYEQTSGNYGLTGDTDITTIPFTIQYTDKAWRLGVTLPFTSIKGDGSVIPGGIGINGSGTGMLPSVFVTETQSGPGDISTSASYAFPQNSMDMFYELTAEIKWGTASARKNLGTGKNDYSLSFYSMFERHEFKPYVSLGYLVIGDSREIDYKNVFYATTGLMYQISPRTSVGVDYDYQQATTEDTDKGKIASLYFSRIISNKWSFNAYLLKGFSASVADSGAGISLYYSFQE